MVSWVSLGGVVGRPRPFSSARSATAWGSPAGRLPLVQAGLVHRDRAAVAVVPGALAHAVDGVDLGALRAAHDAEESPPRLVAVALAVGDGLADPVGALEAARHAERQVAAEAVLVAREPAHGLQAGHEEAEAALGGGRVPAAAARVDRAAVSSDRRRVRAPPAPAVPPGPASRPAPPLPPLPAPPPSWPAEPPPVPPVVTPGGAVGAAPAEPASTAGAAAAGGSTRRVFPVTAAGHGQTEGCCQQKAESRCGHGWFYIGERPVTFSSVGQRVQRKRAYRDSTCHHSGPETPPRGRGRLILGTDARAGGPPVIATDPVIEAYKREVDRDAPPRQPRPQLRGALPAAHGDAGVRRGAEARAAGARGPGAP